MHPILSRLLLALLLFIALQSKAQQYVMIKGQVWDLAGNELVGAHAYNNTRHYGTFTDINGIFFLVMVPGDSLRVSMIGFKPYVMRVPARLSATTYKLDVTLLSDTIILREAVIKPYPETYREFKQEFLSLKVDEEKILERIEMPSEGYGSRYTLPGGGISLPGPASLLYNTFSKEAKELKKMNKLLSRDNLRELLLSKVSLAVLQKQLGLKNEEEIDTAISDCAITSEFLTGNNEYTVIQYLVSCTRERNANRSPK